MLVLEYEEEPETRSTVRGSFQAITQPGRLWASPFLVGAKGWYQTYKTGLHCMEVS